MRKIIPSLLIFCFAFSISALKAQNNCSCWQKRDTSWRVVPFYWDSDGSPPPLSPPLYRNDDASTKPFPNAFTLPFKFCFWGKQIDSIYINNNGNISFGQAYSTFSAFEFPLKNYEMIAPFWGDVDTRDPASGVVYYKLTSHYLIVQWDTVGYYDQNDDKSNTFQVILSDGKDPIIPNGNNVEFCYDTMQWTTGDASHGVNGFDGTPPNPATVGANAGNGTDYIQFGLFGVPGANYLGQYPPFPYDGISWLNGKSFQFNVCSNNTPPIASGISACDTLIVCMGDTLKVPILFLSPKQSDTSKSALLPPVLNGVSVLYNKPGVTDSVLLQIIGNGANYGFHTIKLYGYISNVNPHDTSWAQFVLEVDSNAIGHIVSSGDTICKGDSVKLKAVANVNKYLWSNGKTTDSIEVKPLVTTTYTLQLNKGICDLVLSARIVVVSSITGSFTPSPNPACVGKAVTFTNNTVGANSYKWKFDDPLSGPADSSSLQNPSHTFNTPGSYTVTLIAKNTGGGCNIDTAKQVVTIVALPKPTITGTDSLCTGASNGTLTASGGFTSYTWAPGGQTNATITGLTPGTYTVTVSNGACNGDTSFTIVTKPLPSPGIIAKPDSICAGDSALLTGTGGGTYSWSTGSTRQNIKVTAGTYNVIVTKDGCTASTQKTVIGLSNTPASVGLTANNICPNDSTTLEASGGTSYLWMPGGSTNANYTVDPGKTTTYTCTITTPCRVIDTMITVTYHPFPIVNISGDTSICKGNSTSLTASGGGTYLWSTSQNGSSIIVSPIQDSVFAVSVTLNGCSKDTTIKINVHGVPKTRITPDNKMCAGTEATLTATGACHYKWSNGATTSSITVSPGLTTTYTVRAWCFNDTTGCDTNLSSKLTVDVAVLHACCSATIVNGDSAALLGFGATNYAWTPDFALSCTNCPNPMATPSVTVTYTVSSIDTLNGCAKDTILTVTVNKPCNNLYVPNVFTPNNDGINDDFVISVDTLTPTGERSTWSNFTFYSITIFDRWGKTVYESENERESWNGRILNTQNLAPDGVYYYVIKTTCGGNNSEKRGFVEVIGEK